LGISLKYLERWPVVTALIISATIMLSLQHSLVVASIPDFSNIENISERKTVFFTYLSEQVRPINIMIAKERALLLKLNKQSKLSTKDRIIINRLATKYKEAVPQKDSSILNTKKLLAKLLSKVDQIPIALVLAQAANESAWGTSRFAKQANNYFGIWCFTKGCGLIPKLRGKGQHHEVRTFLTPKDSVSYYIRLLNSSKIYKSLRTIRKDLRTAGTPITAINLTAGLKRYSERGTDYINDLVSFIKFNKLGQKYPLSIQNLNDI
jgi:Bax protein